MCIVFMWRREAGAELKSKLKFILAANRDEFFARPAKEAHFWEDHPYVIAGRDLTEGVAGGTWLGITKQGKLSFLTNIRSEGVTGGDPNKKGRGSLISNFLINTGQPVEQYCDELEPDRLAYRRFNLVCGDLTTDEFYYMNSVDENACVSIKPGPFGMSNGTLDSKWYKVERNREKFQRIIQEHDVNTTTENDNNIALLESLQTFLEDTERHYPDPNVTVNNPMNEYLSSCFIPTFQGYGTRTNTIITVDENDNVTFLERTKENVDDPVSKWRRSLFNFKLETSSASL